MTASDRSTDAVVSILPEEDRADGTLSAAPPAGEGTSSKSVRDEDEEDEATRRQKALARLMLRISEHADFPSLKESIGGIQSVARSERSHLHQLSDKVLNDVGLTGKLLRIINAAFYRSAGGGSITSMQRAIALMGFETVSMLAASLALFERVPKGRDGEAVRAECSKSLLAGLLAQQLCHSGKHYELAYLTALFMNLGRMLVMLHFPNEARAIRQEMKKAIEARERQAQAEAALHTGAVKQVQALSDAQLHELNLTLSKQVLGLTEEDLGMEVAHQWGWPDHLVTQLRRLHPDDLTQPVSSQTYLRTLCTAACDLAATLAALPKAGTPDEQLEARNACLERFGHTACVPLGLNPDSLPGLGELAIEKWDMISEFLGLNSNTGNAAPAGPRPPTAASPTRTGRKPVQTKGPDRIAHALQQTLDELTQAALSDLPLEEVLDQVMLDLTEALSVQRIVICLRDDTSGELVANSSMGVRASAVSAAFRVPLGDSQDLFSVLCLNAKDALIADTSDPVISRRLPPWYAQKVGARTFVLLPMAQNGRVNGLMYADRQMAGSLVLKDSELNLLKSVRNQVIVAMRHRCVWSEP